MRDPAPPCDIHADIVEQDIGVKGRHIILDAQLDKAPAWFFLAVVVARLTESRRAVLGLASVGVTVEVWLRTELLRLAHWNGECGY